jgi:membrane-bound lytic murein transglycosylase B
MPAPDGKRLEGNKNPKEDRMRLGSTGCRAKPALLAALLAVAAPATAMAQACGNTSAGFGSWLTQFKSRAAAQGVSPSALE